MVKTIDRKHRLLKACKHLDRYLEKRYDAGLNLIFLSVQCSSNRLADAIAFQSERDFLGVGIAEAEALMRKAEKGIHRANKYFEYLEAYRKKYDIFILEEQIVYFKGCQLLFTLTETSLDLTRSEKLSLWRFKNEIFEWLLPIKDRYNLRLYRIIEVFEKSYIEISKKELSALIKEADWVIPRIEGDAICFDLQKGDNMRYPASSQTIICRT